MVLVSIPIIAVVAHTAITAETTDDVPGETMRVVQPGAAPDRSSMVTRNETQHESRAYYEAAWATRIRCGIILGFGWRRLVA